MIMIQGFVLLAALACAPALAAGAGFYAPAPDRGAGLPETGIYPRGRRMAFMGYSGKPERDLARGFTAAGPAYTDEPEYLERAFRGGWPVVAHVGRGISYDDGRPDKYRMHAVHESSVAARVGAEVRALAGHSEIVWWAVLPEELRPWRSDEMRYLAAVTAAIRANDPLGRPIYHYNPNGGSARRLTPIARQVDILGMGAYVNLTGHKRDRGWAARGMREMIAAIAAAKRPEVVPLVMPELHQDPDPAEDGEIRAWARHDLYAGLAGGAKGVLIWSLFKRPGVVRTWELWYEAYAECARELNGEQGLASIFLFGEPRRELAVRWEGKPASDKSTAEFAYGASRWLFAVNSGNAPAAFTVAGFPPASRVSDAFARAPLDLTPGQPLRLELPAYGVAALRFEAAPKP